MSLLIPLRRERLQQPRQPFSFGAGPPSATVKRVRERDFPLTRRMSTMVGPHPIERREGAIALVDEDHGTKKPLGVGGAGGVW